MNSYMRGYRAARRRGQRESIEMTQAAKAAKFNIFGSITKLIGNLIGDRDGRISKEEYAEAIVKREQLLAQLEAGGKQIEFLAKKWNAAAERLGETHGDFDNIADGFMEIQNLAPDIWFEYPEIKLIYNQEIEPVMAMMDITQYHDRFEHVYQILEDLADAFLEEIDETLAEFEQLGIRSIYHPLQEKRLKVGEKIKAILER